MFAIFLYLLLFFLFGSVYCNFVKNFLINPEILTNFRVQKSVINFPKNLLLLSKNSMLKLQFENYYIIIKLFNGLTFKGHP